MWVNRKGGISRRRHERRLYVCLRSKTAVSVHLLRYDLPLERWSEARVPAVPVLSAVGILVFGFSEQRELEGWKYQEIVRGPEQCWKVENPREE
jgi:hypothetical protein